MNLSFFREIIFSIYVFAALVSCGASEARVECENANIQPPIVFGNSRFEAYVPYLKGHRVALLVNKSSIVDGVHLCDTLLAQGVNVVKIFAPEHGFRGNADAGEKISDAIDSTTGLPIVSLYGKNKKPTAEQLRDIDILVYDLQDVGVRFYTYISTMHYAMEACAENQKTMIVLDRPNPNGDYIDGPVLESECRSFVGMDPIPIVYGLTAGELAAMINGEKWLQGDLHCDLKVVTMLNYNHARQYNVEIAPSPNLKTPHAIKLYPSLCFFEATNVSVGRGTNYPFEVLGAPQYKKGNFSFTPQPTEGASVPLHNGKLCYGTDLRNIDVPQKISLEYFIEYRNELGNEFWQNPKFFDLLAGNRVLRQQIEQGLSEDSIRATWQQQLEVYKNKRQKYLLYDRSQYTFEPIDWQLAMKSHWVDSVYTAMTPHERIAQLVWIALDGNPSETAIDRACEAIEKYGIGGVLLLQMSVNDIVPIVEKLSEHAKYPLLIAVDGENGLAMRMSDAIVYPKNNFLGEHCDTATIEQLGRFIGQQMRACGINVNFAPVVDVNTNPLNPIIGKRAFGASSSIVARCGVAISRGMQSEGIIAVAKHFPGHGDTDVDSHLALPIVRHDKSRLDSVELAPFRAVISDGIMGVMSGHLIVPALDSTGTAASLSNIMLSDLLRKEMKFDGLIISDAMNMQGAKIAGKGKNLETMALIAGNDVVEFSTNVDVAINSISAALRDTTLGNMDFEIKVKRVLAAKKWCKLDKPRQFFGDPAVIINSIEAEMFAQKLKQLPK